MIFDRIDKMNKIENMLKTIHVNLVNPVKKLPFCKKDIPMQKPNLVYITTHDTGRHTQPHGHFDRIDKMNKIENMLKQFM